MHGDKQYFSGYFPVPVHSADMAPPRIIVPDRFQARKRLVQENRISAFMSGSRNINKLQNGNVNRLEINGRTGIHYIISFPLCYLGLLVELFTAE